MNTDSIHSSTPIFSPTASCTPEEKSTISENSGKEESELPLETTIRETSLRKIEKIMIPADRKEEMRNSVKDILYNQQPLVKTTTNQFAFLHCSTFLKESGLEGGDKNETVSYWLNLMKSWIAGKEKMADPGLSQAQLLEIQDTMKDSEEFFKIFLLALVIDDGKTPEKVLSLMEKKLGEKGKFYFPSGWGGLPGHFMMLKFHLEKDQVVIEPMTTGGGAEFHQMITKGPHKYKINYKWNPVTIPKDTLFHSELGNTFIKNLIELKDIKTEKLDAPDLYGLIALVGTIKELPQEKQSEIGMTSQRSGTCTETGYHMPVYDVILNDPLATEKNIKRAMYAVKFQSLTDGFRQYRNLTENAFVLFMLREASKSHLIRLLKLYPEILTDKEFFLGYSIGIEILDYSEAEIKKVKQNQSLEIPSTRVTNIKSDYIANLEDIAHNTSQDGEKRADFTIPSPTAEQLTPQKIVDILLDYQARISQQNETLPPNKSNQELFAEIYELMLRLPVTSGDPTDPFWDQVPVNQISQCLSILSNLSLLACKNAYSNPKMDINSKIVDFDRERLLFITARAYDISCQIAPRIPDLKMEGFPFEWNPYNLINFLIRKSPQTSDTLIRIDDNFRKRNKRSIISSQYPLFYPVHKLDDQNHPCAHLAYCKQFVTEQNFEKIKTNSKKCHVNADQCLIMDPDRSLYPQEFYFLQQTAILNNISIQGVDEYKKAFDKNFDPTFFAYQPTSQNDNSPLQLNELEFKYHNLLHPKLKDSNNHPYRHLLGREENAVLNEFINQKFEIKNSTPAGFLPSLEELTLIRSESKLQVQETLGWIAHNLPLLKGSFVQGLIEESLFTQGVLRIALKESYGPTSSKIQETLAHIFNLYSHQAENLSTLLWLVRLGVALESHLRVASSDKPKELTFPDYYAILEEMVAKCESTKKRSLIFQHQLLSFSPLDPDDMKTQDYTHLLSSRLRLEMCGLSLSDDEPNASHSGLDAYIKHRDGLKNLL